MDTAQVKIASAKQLQIVNHMSGKTILLQANIRRELERMGEDEETPYLLIICVWQEGADALLEQYKALANNLPQGNNVEVLVLSKQEILKKFMVPKENCTTDEINCLCQNIETRIKNKKVSLFIDECWVTAPIEYSAHLTTVNILQ